MAINLPLVIGGVTYTPREDSKGSLQYYTDNTGARFDLQADGGLKPHQAFSSADATLIKSLEDGRNNSVYLPDPADRSRSLLFYPNGSSTGYQAIRSDGTIVSITKNTNGDYVLNTGASGFDANATNVNSVFSETDVAHARLTNQGNRFNISGVPGSVEVKTDSTGKMTQIVLHSKPVGEAQGDTTTTYTPDTNGVWGTNDAAREQSPQITAHLREIALHANASEAVSYNGQRIIPVVEMATSTDSKAASTATVTNYYTADGHLVLRQQIDSNHLPTTNYVVVGASGNFAAQEVVVPATVLQNLDANSYASPDGAFHIDPVLKPDGLTVDHYEITTTQTNANGEIEHITKPLYVDTSGNLVESNRSVSAADVNKAREQALQEYEDNINHKQYSLTDIAVGILSAGLLSISMAVFNFASLRKKHHEKIDRLFQDAYQQQIDKGMPIDEAAAMKTVAHNLVQAKQEIMEGSARTWAVSLALTFAAVSVLVAGILTGGLAPLIVLVATAVGGIVGGSAGYFGGQKLGEEVHVGKVLEAQKDPNNKAGNRGRVSSEKEDAARYLEQIAEQKRAREGVPAASAAPVAAASAAPSAPAPTAAPSAPPKSAVISSQMPTAAASTQAPAANNNAIQAILDRGPRAPMDQATAAPQAAVGAIKQ